MREKLILRGAGLISVVFLTIFGGVLDDLAPPLNPLRTQGEGFLAATACLAALIVFLIVFFIGIQLPGRQRSRILAGLALAGTLVGALVFIRYFDLREEYAFTYPTDDPDGHLYNKGSEQTALTDSLVRSRPQESSELVNRVGGLENIGRLWTPESIRRVHRLLAASFLTYILSLAWAIFAFVEAAIHAQGPGSRGRSGAGSGSDRGHQPPPTRSNRIGDRAELSDHGE